MIPKHINHRWLYGGLILGFLMKSLGAAWDVSYHFKHFREFLQLPHLLNGAGDALIIVLLIYLWIKEPKGNRRPLKIIIFGIVFFVFSIGVDQWYHEKFGLDLTTWSPAHFMLYVGSFIALLGSYLYVLQDYNHSRISISMKKWMGLIFAAFILDSLWFPLVFQEQGVIMDYFLKRGVRLADPDLLDMFFKTHTDVYGGLPAWLYGTWVVLSVVFVFHFIKRMELHKYSATIVSALYLIVRLVTNSVFASVNYPLSTVPYYLIFIAIAYDLIYLSLKNSFAISRVIITGIIPIAGIAIVGLINTSFPIHPPIPVLTVILYGIGAAIVGYLCAEGLFRWLFKSYT